jgi:hypothetical protein
MDPYYGNIRLINNDNITGLIIAEDSIEITIERPIQITMESVKDSSDMFIVYYPWLPVAATEVNTVTISRDKFFYVVPITKEGIEHLQKYMTKAYERKKAEETKVASKSIKTSSNPLDELEELLGGSTPDKKKLS